MTKLVSNALCLAVLAGVGLALPGLAKAAPTCGPKRILVVYADTARPDQLRAALLAEPGVATLDYFDAHGGTPTASQLAPYNLVLTFSNSSYADGTSLGNVLADYEDQGAGLVQQLSFSYRGPDQPYGLNGRWVTGNYAPFTYSTALLTNPAMLGTYDASDPLLAGVTALSTNFRLGISAASGSTVVASWNDAVPAVAVRGTASSGSTPTSTLTRPGAASSAT